MDEWFYAHGREKCGPIPRAQLLEFLTTGVVTPGTLVWCREMTEWTPAIQVPGLLDSGPQPEVPAPESSGANSWENLLAAAQPAGGTVSEAPSADANGVVESSAVAGEGEGGNGALSFSKKRPKPPHKRFGARIKTLVVRGVAACIAVGIAGVGGYLGAQHFGLFDDPVPARLLYLPDHPDFVVSLNVQELMSAATSFGVDPAAVPVSVNGAMPIGPNDLQDVTVAGNVLEKRWVVIATVTRELDPETLFPGGGGDADTVRAGGTKIYYDAQMANYGMDFAVALPSKSTLLVGPLETLKDVLKRRSAPELPQTFRTVLDRSGPSDAWFLGAADLGSLWRFADKHAGELPASLSSEQRWLAESISEVAFSVRGAGEYVSTLTARCKEPKDAPLIKEKIETLIAEQKGALLEQIHAANLPVGPSTMTLLDSVEIEQQGAMLILTQEIDREMIEQSSRQLTAAGIGAGLP